MSIQVSQITPGFGENQYILQQLRTRSTAAANNFERSPKNDTLSSARPQNNRKVTFGEGVGLMAKGFFNKAGGIIINAFKHPFQTLGVIGLTTAGLFALTLIGISATTGAAALAIGFGALAAANTIVHTTQAIKHNNSGDYDKTRKDLQKIGGDGFDLLLSLPFVPKAIKEIKNHIKYNPKLLYINEPMVNELKQSKNVKDVFYSFLKGDVHVKYHQMANEMGIKVKPNLVIHDDMPTGYFRPVNAQIEINSRWLNPLNVMKLKINSALSGQKADIMMPEAKLRSTLEHVRNMQNIARMEGIGAEGMTEIFAKYCKEEAPYLEQNIEQLRFEIEMYKNPDAARAKMEAKLKSNREESSETEPWLTPDEGMPKVDTDEDILSEAVHKTTMSNIDEFAKYVKTLPESHVNATVSELEKQLRFLEKEHLSSKQVLSGNTKAINKGFYKDAVDQSGIIGKGSDEYLLAQRFLDGFFARNKIGQRNAELNYMRSTKAISQEEYEAEIMKNIQEDKMMQIINEDTYQYIVNNLTGFISSKRTAVTQGLSSLSDPVSD